MNYSQAIKFDYEDVTSFVSSLYADNKKPCERFGMTWEELSSLEEEVPEITQPTGNDVKKCA